MNQKGTYLVNTFALDDLNRVLRLIQSKIADSQASQNIAMKSIQSSISTLSSATSSGNTRTLHIVATDTGGNILINEVGRGFMTPVTVLGV